VRVRGAATMMTLLMFGFIAVTATQPFWLLVWT